MVGKGENENTFYRGDEFARLEKSKLRSGDLVAQRELQEQNRRDVWVEIAKAKAARTAVKECYRREGVNFQHNCQKEMQEYLVFLKKHGFWSTLNPPQ